jgi:methylenetetrahydrofolate reductase (NADPH)
MPEPFYNTEHRPDKGRTEQEPPMSEIDPTAQSAAGVPAVPSHLATLVAELTYEIVPISTVDGAIEALPPRSNVSVTCSPTKGLDATLALSERVASRGHHAIPHLAARMVAGPRHAARLAAWCREHGITQAFIVGGDADAPVHYRQASTFLEDLLAAEPGLTTVGVTAYPDGHAIIDTAALNEALLRKQAILDQAGVDGYASTQMCFDPATIGSWLTARRADGLTMPIHLGVAGAVDRSKLMTMGVRLGIGTSLSFLKKNRRAIGGLLTKTDYSPSTLLNPLADQLEPLGVTGLHCFTFNQVAATAVWQREYLAND